MAKTKESQLRASRKWKETHKDTVLAAEKESVKVQIRLHKSTDKDILDKLENVDNKQSYIKGLIREDIRKI